MDFVKGSLYFNQIIYVERKDVIGFEKFTNTKLAVNIILS